MMKPMASLQIRDLPDDVYRALLARARREGRSLAQQALHELRKLVEVQAEQRRRELLESLRGRAPAATDLDDPVELIREDREA